MHECNAHICSLSLSCLKSWDVTAGQEEMNMCATCCCFERMCAVCCVFWEEGASRVRVRKMFQGKSGGSYSALQAPVRGRRLKACGIGPAQLATHYSFYFCRFGICLNLTICSNSKMFQFETIEI
jgi:hypothetical protein